MAQLLTIAILFLASFTRSAVGFGDALLGMPLLALALGLRTATPVYALAAIVLGATHPGDKLAARRPAGGVAAGAVGGGGDSVWGCCC